MAIGSEYVRASMALASQANHSIILAIVIQDVGQTWIGDIDAAVSAVGASMDQAWHVTVSQTEMQQRPWVCGK